MPKRQQWEQQKSKDSRGLSAVAGDSLWPMEPRGLPERRCTEGSPRSSLGKALDVSVFFLRLNEIPPGLTSLPGPGEKRLGSRVPEKNEGMKRENKLVVEPCAWSSTTHACAEGLSSPSGRRHPPGGAQTTREGGQDSKAVCTQEARVASQAGSLPGGGIRRVLL